eukprot:gene1599-32988_t
MTMYKRCAIALRSLYKTPGNAPPCAVKGEEKEEEDDMGKGPSGSDPSQSQQEGYGGGGNYRGRGRGRGGRGGGNKRQKRGADEEDEDSLPPGTHLREALLNPSFWTASRPTTLMPAGVPEWVALINARQAEATGVPISQRGVHSCKRVKRIATGDGESEGRAISEPEAIFLMERDEEVGLNRSQVSGIALALKHQVSVLQGPPGTGKTTTIVKFLKLLKHKFGFTLPVLACAQSNVAVDNLLEGLSDCGVNVVRVGQPVKVRESLRDATLDARLLAHPLQESISELDGRIKTLRRELPSLRGRDRGMGHRDVSIMSKELKEMRVKMARDVIQGAEVICSTCVGAGSEQLEEVEFAMVVLDEGSQCSEPESLIPLTKGSRHVVLVGDHCQLPPVVLSREATQGGLAQSLFERLIQARAPSAMLQVQYRMHPSLSVFPSMEFYSGKLVDGVQAVDRPPPSPYPAFFPNAMQPITFIDVAGAETANQSGSKVPVISSVLQKRGVSVAGNSAMATTDAAGFLEVKSVDGYQGREKDIIVVSCVRSNTQGQVGSLDDWRRMNVQLAS